MAKVIQTSFASGEISPQLFGRVDLEKYKNGLALCRNFFVDYRGGVTNRPGTSLVGYSRQVGQSANVRLIPFQYSVIQTYILEFSDKELRIIVNGGYVVNNPVGLQGVVPGPGNEAVFELPNHGFGFGDQITATDGTLLPLASYYVNPIDANSFYLNDLFGETVLYGAGSPAGIAKIYVLPTPWASADLPLLKYTQSADTMTLTHPNYIPYDLQRVLQNSWNLVPLTFTATLSAPVVTSAVVVATNFQNGQVNYYGSWSYQITAVDATGQETVGSVPRSVGYPIDISLQSGYANVTWSPVAGAVYYNVYRSAITTAYEIAEGAAFGLVGNTYGTNFVDRNVTPDYTKAPPTHNNPFAPGAITSINVTANGSGYNENSPYVLTDPTGTGAVLQPVFLNGLLNSMYVVNSGQGYTNPQLSFPTDGTGAAATCVVGPQTGVNPGCCTYFQQRKYFAGSANKPDTLWASVPGQFQNFDVTVPAVDSDSIDFTLVSNQVNNIKYMISYTSGLVILTGSGAWLLSSGSQAGGAVTPTNADARAQVFNGCADVTPLTINYNILYVQNKGSIVRSLEYNFYLNIFTGVDMSILASHLFAPNYITQWAYQEEPFKVIWCVRNDGILLSFTFLKDQEVYGWARHDTLGTVESVCTITEGIADSLYLTVIREVNGVQVRFLEKMQPRLISGLSEAWFVDCGLSFSGTPQQTFSGLTHLNNSTVSILADGNVLPQQVVENGKITLPVAASNVVIGLPYTSQLQTLPIDAGSSPSIQGSEKSLNRLTIKVDQTMNVYAGRDFQHLQETGTGLFPVTGLYSGNLQQFTTDPLDDEYGQLCLQISDPVPCTILAVVPDIEFGDTSK